MSIPFTQFLMPDGRRTKVTIKRSHEIEEMAHKIIATGYSFEIEMCSDYKTISMEIINSKERVLAGELCPNGPTQGGRLGVPESVDKMVRDAFPKIPKRFRDMEIVIPTDDPLALFDDKDAPF